MFNYDKVLKTIYFSNPDKAPGHDGASVRMLKLSSPSIIKARLIIFWIW